MHYDVEFEFHIKVTGRMPANRGLSSSERKCSIERAQQKYTELIRYYLTEECTRILPIRKVVNTQKKGLPFKVWGKSENAGAENNRNLLEGAVTSGNGATKFSNNFTPVIFFLYKNCFYYTA
jgi:hypothetical protein